MLKVFRVRVASRTYRPQTHLKKSIKPSAKAMLCRPIENGMSNAIQISFRVNEDEARTPGLSFVHNANQISRTWRVSIVNAFDSFTARLLKQHLRPTQPSSNPQETAL